MLLFGGTFQDRTIKFGMTKNINRTKNECTLFVGDVLLREVTLARGNIAE